MLVINSSIQKRELLQNLATVATEKQTLIIEIQSLPTFLATPIAFTIFNYQISNYPRKVSWASSDIQILEFLKACQVDVDIPDSNQNTVTVETESDLPPQTKPQNDNSEVQEIYAEVEFVEKTKAPNSFDLKPANLNSNSGFSDSFFSGSKNKITAKDLLKKDSYSPSSLLDSFFENSISEVNSEIHQTKPEIEFKPIIAIRPNPKTLEQQSLLSYQIQSENQAFEPKIQEVKNDKFAEQNLDNWLEKIEATRQALNTLKSQEEIQVKKPNIFFKTLQFSSALVVLSAFVLGFYAAFPTNVYSVDVVPQTKNTQNTIDLPVSKFLIQNRPLTEAGETAGTGVEIVNLNQARGKVLLVNRSGGPISFNRNGIILIAPNGSEYRQLAVSGDPATYVIPGRSNVVGGSSEISIQSEKSGSSFNLPKDTVLKVYNLNRDLIGGLFTATVTEEISISKASGKKIIQDQDLKKLQQENLLQLQNKAQQQLSLIANETTFVDPKWYNLNDVIDVFTQASGDVAETVGLTTTTNAKLYYLNQVLLEDELKKLNDDMSKLLEVKTVNYSGDFSRSDSRVQITIDYDYIQKTNIDEADLINQLSNQDFDKTSSNIKKQYPQITEIKKQEQGVRLPGVPARVNLNIDQN